MKYEPVIVDSSPVEVVTAVMWSSHWRYGKGTDEFCGGPSDRELGQIRLAEILRQLLFRGDSTATIFDSILNRPPVPAVRLNPDVPAELEHIINRALEKDRELRYQHASEMRSELQHLKRDTEKGRMIAAGSGTMAVAQESGAQVAAQPPLPTSRSSPALATSPSSSAVNVAVVPVAGRKLWRIVVPAAAILLGGWLYFRSHQAATHSTTTTLTEKDTIVLADFDNKTGDVVFDDALKQAVSVQFARSPFFNFLPDQRVWQELEMMGYPSTEHVTQEMAQEVCLRIARKRCWPVRSRASASKHSVLNNAA